MNYFISDLHLGHGNVIKLCNRPFKDAEQMDKALLENWNDRVKKSDTVYIAGDLIWQTADPEKYLPRLNGKKVLILGNHDRWAKSGLYDSYFEIISPYLETKVDNISITFCHYPMVEWSASRKMGCKKLAFHVYGHIHNGYQEGYENLFTTPHSLNAGADINGFKPVTFEELRENNFSHKLSHLTKITDKARLIAATYHLYQADRAGQPYFKHCTFVASKFSDEKLKSIAYLHDVLEDTDAPLKLLEDNFPQDVISAVLALTKKQDEDYFEYIQRVGQNPLARQIKIADLTHNSDLSRIKIPAEEDFARCEKYRKALKMLNGQE